MYKSLQSGRAIAALLVLLFHLGGALASEKYFGIAEFAIPFLFGNAGVEFFFVLSGFIIYYAHQQDISNPSRLKHFAFKRLARIYPSYWIIFFCVYFVAIRATYDQAVPTDLWLVIKSALLLPQNDGLGSNMRAPVIIVAWTLQREMVFYAAFAAAIYQRALGIGIFLTLGVLYTYRQVYGVNDFPLSFFASDYLWLFAMGIVVAKICRSESVQIKNPRLFLLGGCFVFLIVAIDVVCQINQFARFHTLLYGLGSSGILLGLVVSEDQGRVYLKQPFWQLMGAASYALYLLHYPLISAFCKAAMWLQLDQFGLPGALVVYVFILLACIGAALLFHQWIEKPIGQFLHRHVSGRAIAG